MNPQNILLAIDYSPSSEQAVDYVGRMLNGISREFLITVMHVIEDTPPDFIENAADRDQRIESLARRADSLLKKARQTLTSYGFPEENIRLKAPLRQCESLASCILAEQRSGAWWLAGEASPSPRNFFSAQCRTSF